MVKGIRMSQRPWLTVFLLAAVAAAQSVPAGPAQKPAPAKSQAAPAETLKTDAPKADAPKAETPKADAPKAETPKAETPKADAPKAETPKAETPKAETPKAETPKADAQKAETPKAETPKADAPKADAPKADAPKAETPKPLVYTVKVGTRIPLYLLNSLSTRHSETGDLVYLQTAFPVLVRGRIVIPVGSYVTGTVTEVKRPSRAKGPAELYVRFETLTLPNGVTRHFNARMGGMDGTVDAKVDRAEGKVTADGNHSGDARTVAETGGIGASVGGIAGSGSNAPLTGLGIGAGVGAAAGLIGILASHAPDAVLPKGTTVEMVLDRPLNFTEIELD